LFTNRGKLPVDIWLHGLTVQTEQGLFSPPWEDVYGQSTFRLYPDANLVLAETENFNFDTSDGGLGIDPVVSVRISTDLSGTQDFSVTDSKRVLLGNEEKIGPGESSHYVFLDVLNFPDPEGPHLLANPAMGSCSNVGSAVFSYTNYGNMPAPFHVDDAVFSLVNGDVATGTDVQITFNLFPAVGRWQDRRIRANATA